MCIQIRIITLNIFCLIWIISLSVTSIECGLSKFSENSEKHSIFSIVKIFYFKNSLLVVLWGK